MSHQKVLTLLTSFEPKMWQECRRFINKRYQTKTNERLLFGYLYRQREHLSQSPSYTQIVKQKVVPKVSDGAYNNITSRLGRCLEEFIIDYELSQKEQRWERQMILLKYYKKKGLGDYFQSVADDLLEDERDLSNYNLQKRLHIYLTGLEVGFSELPIKRRSPYFLESRESLKVYYEQMMLLYSIEVENRKILYNQLFDQKTSDALGAEATDANHLLRFLNYLSKLVGERDHEAYLKLREELYTAYPFLSDKLGEIALIYLVNYGYHRVKKGDLSMKEDIIELYDWGVESGLLLQNGFLSENQFLNIIELKAQLYIDVDHTDLLEKLLLITQTEDKDTLRDIGWSYILLWKEDYANGLTLLNAQRHSRDNVHLPWRMRWLRLCCTWGSQPDHQNYKVVIQGYEKYFRRNKKEMSIDNYKGSMNLVKIVKMLWEGRDTASIQAKFDEAEHLIFRSWLKKILEYGQAQEA